MFRRNKNRTRQGTRPSIPWSAKSHDTGQSLHDQIIGLKAKAHSLKADTIMMMEAFNAVLRVATDPENRQNYVRYRYHHAHEILTSAYTVLADLQVGMERAHSRVTKERQRLENEVANRIDNGETPYEIASRKEHPHTDTDTDTETGTEVTVSFVSVRRPSPIADSGGPRTDDNSEETSSESANEPHNPHDQ